MITLQAVIESYTMKYRAYNTNVASFTPDNFNGRRNISRNDVKWRYFVYWNKAEAKWFLEQN